ncbi:MAG: metal-sulfur cluster assembly factor, partial [bacterium]
RRLTRDLRGCYNSSAMDRFPAAGDTDPLTRDQVIQVLRTIYDPEIPVNIWDLGLIYDIAQENGKVRIQMTLTALGCPIGPVLAEEIRWKVGQLPGVEEVEVDIVFNPPWTPERLTEEGRLALQSMGYPV